MPVGPMAEYVSSVVVCESTAARGAASTQKVLLSLLVSSVAVPRNQVPHNLLTRQYFSMAYKKEPPASFPVHNTHSARKES